MPFRQRGELTDQEISAVGHGFRVLKKIAARGAISENELLRQKQRLPTMAQLLREFEEVDFIVYVVGVKRSPHWLSKIPGFRKWAPLKSFTDVQITTRGREIVEMVGPQLDAMNEMFKVLGST